MKVSISLRTEAGAMFTPDRIPTIQQRVDDMLGMSYMLGYENLALVCADYAIQLMAREEMK